MLDAHFSSALVAGEGAREIVERDQANGYVVHGDGEALGIVERKQSLVGALVARQPFLEAILAMVNVANVDLNVGQALLIVQAREDFFGAFGGLEGFVVLAKQDEGLNRGNQRSRFFLLVADFSKDLEG